MSQEIHFHGTHAELRHILWDFVRGLSGSGDFAPYVRGVKLRVGMVALMCVQEAFVAKAAGGTGEDGITWDKLQKATIANRPIGQGDVAGLRSQGITRHQYGYGARRQGAGDLDSRGRLKRGFLTESQDKRWRLIFATRKASLRAKFGLSDGEASARAAQIAWTILKSEGAKTKLDVLGNRSVQIGRDTDRMFLSLSPGTTEPEQHPLLADPPEAPEPGDRILRDEDGSVIVGSNVIYAGKFHAKRKLWPEDLPAPWAERIEDAAQSGVQEAVTLILEGA